MSDVLDATQSSTVDPMSPVFSSADVAKAIGMTSPNFRAQFTRRHWRVIGKPAQANGFGHLFSLEDALGLGLARELVDCGVHPAEAFRQGVERFAHTGSETRRPGRPYPSEMGNSWFAYSPRKAAGFFMASDSGVDLTTIELRLGAGSFPVILVDVTALVDRITASLCVDLRDLDDDRVSQ